MTIDKKWLDYIDIYGADFHRWPDMPDAADQKTLMALPDYQQAKSVDNALEAIEFPTMSNDALVQIYTKIAADNASKKMVFFYVPRSVRFLSLTCAMLGLGFLAGVSSQGVTQNEIHDYYTIGPMAYTYNMSEE